MPEFSANKHYKAIRNVCIFLALLPIVWLTWHFLLYRWQPNPFSLLSHSLGHASILLLLTTLAITPLRFWFSLLFRQTRLRWGKRMADWNFLVRLRRPLGLLAFFYLCLHMLVYFYMELDFIWQEYYYELQHRHFIAFGSGAALVMAVLAITSANHLRKRLGRWWLWLHRLNYVLIILAVSHHWLSVKTTQHLPGIYTAATTLLLLHRLLVYITQPELRRRDAEAEVKR